MTNPVEEWRADPRRDVEAPAALVTTNHQGTFRMTKSDVRPVTREHLAREIAVAEQHLSRHRALHPRFCWPGADGFDGVSPIIELAIEKAQTALRIGGPAMWEAAMRGLGAEGFIPGDRGYIEPGAPA